MKKQIHLEAIRGLAALVVVLSHFFAAFYPAAIFGPNYPSHAGWERLFTTTPLALLFASHFAVCLFFILSGFVLSAGYFADPTKDSGHLLAAIVKRPVRLGGLVLASVLIAFCLLRMSAYFNMEVSRVSYSTPWFTQYWNEGPIGLKRLCTDLVFNPFGSGVKYNGPLWTIELELYGSLITYGILLLFRKWRIRWFVYLYAMVYAHGQLYQGFILGIALADASCSFAGTLERWKKPYISLPILVAGLLFASHPHYVETQALAGTVYGKFPHLPALGGGYSMLGAVTLFVAVMLSPWLQQALSGPVFAFLGRISYALYAIHFVVLGSFSSWLFLKLLPSWGYAASFGFVFTVSLVLLVPISYLLWKYVDLPATNAADRLAKVWTKAST